jgi:hypothetical protein
MARHHVFTIVSDIINGSEPALRWQLENDPAPDFSSLAMVHFASLVIFDKDKLSDKASHFIVTHSKLVFECNIDGSVGRYLEQLIADPAIDLIYQHCVGYPLGGGKDAKLRYLRKHVRWPQLFHVGAPYRSAGSIRRDRDLRNVLDRHLDALMVPSLNKRVARSTAGLRERWTWDVSRPWIAVAVGVAGPALSLWLWLLIRRLNKPWPMAVLLSLILVSLAALSAKAAFVLWVTSGPELRARVRPWFKWGVAGIISAVLVWLLWDERRSWALGLAAAFVVALVGSVYAAVQRLMNERLLAIRSDAADPSIVTVWNALRRYVAEDDERPGWWRRLGHWAPVPIAYVVVLALIWMLDRFPWLPAFVSPRWFLVAVLTALFAAKAWWLSVLVGWPGESDTATQDYKRILAFRALVPVVAFVAFTVLTSLGIEQWLLALIVVVSIFSMWAIPLATPPLEPRTLTPKELDALLQAEDRDVQNHMAALVPIKQDRRFRMPVLKSFLWLLNKFFYRSVLPDLYRGKFFGLTSVQFAQWIALDRRNFIFLSNYDYSWTSYLDDFGLELTTGIQKIWGQGEGNPGTKDLGRFKSFARSTMVAHSRWYRAYPGLALRQVWNNEQLRRELAGADGEERMINALRRLGAAPKTLPQLPYARIN